MAGDQDTRATEGSRGRRTFLSKVGLFLLERTILFSRQAPAAAPRLTIRENTASQTRAPITASPPTPAPEIAEPREAPNAALPQPPAAPPDPAPVANAVPNRSPSPTPPRPAAFTTSAAVIVQESPQTAKFRKPMQGYPNSFAGGDQPRAPMKVITLNRLGLGGVLKDINELPANNRVIFLAFFTKRKSREFAPCCFLSFPDSQLYLIDFGTTGIMDAVADDGSRLTIRSLLSSEDFEKLVVTYDDLRMLVKTLKKPAKNIAVLRHEDQVTSMNGDVILRGKARSQRVEETSGAGLIRNFDREVREAIENIGRRCTKAMAEDAKPAVRRHIAIDGLASSMWDNAPDSERGEIKAKTQSAQLVFLGQRAAMFQQQQQQQSPGQDDEEELQRLRWLGKLPAAKAAPASGRSSSVRERESRTPSRPPLSDRFSSPSTRGSADRGGDRQSAREAFRQAGREFSRSRDGDHDEYRADVPDDMINPPNEFRQEYRTHTEVLRSHFRDEQENNRDDHSSYSHSRRDDPNEPFDVSAGLARARPNGPRRREHRDRFDPDFVDSEMRDPREEYYRRTTREEERIINGHRSMSPRRSPRSDSRDGEDERDYSDDRRRLRDRDRSPSYSRSPDGRENDTSDDRSPPQRSPRPDLLIDLDRSTPISAPSKPPNDMITATNGLETLDLSSKYLGPGDQSRYGEPQDEVPLDRRVDTRRSREPSQTTANRSVSGIPPVRVTRAEQHSHASQQLRQRSRSPSTHRGANFVSSAFAVHLTSRDDRPVDSELYDIKLADLAHDPSVAQEIEGLKLHFQVKSKQPCELSIQMDGEGGFTFRVKRA